MQTCNCKLCREGHREVINNLPDQGLNKEEIQEWIKENLGFTISKSTLKQHFELSGIEVQSSISKSEVQPLEAVDIKAAMDCNIADWVGSTNSRQIKTKLQEIHLEIHFLLAARAKTHLERFINGEARTFPPAVLKDLDTSFSMIRALCGLEKLEINLEPKE